VPVQTALLPVVVKLDFSNSNQADLYHRYFDFTHEIHPEYGCILAIEN
jgi:hypothetical protein